MDRFFNELFAILRNQSFEWKNILDIAIVFVFIYYALVLIRGTRAVQLLLGVLVLFFIYGVAVLAGLNLTKLVLQALAVVAVVAIPIVFQPELRRALGQLGQLGPLNRLLTPTDDDAVDQVVDELTRAALLISGAKHGALIVVERGTGPAGLQRIGCTDQWEAHRRAPRFDLHGPLAASRWRGHRAWRDDRRRGLSSAARGDPRARNSALRDAASRGALDQLADRRGRHRRLRGDPRHLDRQQWSHHRGAR